MESDFSCSLCWLTMEQKLKTKKPTWKILISEHLKRCSKYLTDDENESFTDDIEYVGCDFCFDSVKKMNALIAQLEKVQKEVVKFADEFSNSIKKRKKLATKNSGIRVKQEIDAVNSTNSTKSEDCNDSEFRTELSVDDTIDAIRQEVFIKSEKSLDTVKLRRSNENYSSDSETFENESESRSGTNIERKETLSGTHTNKELRVDVKRLEFDNKKRLPNLNKENFYCEKCDRKFFRKRTFQIHNRIHETKKKNIAKCEMCKKGFEDLWRLEHHKKSVHQTERPFQCSFCSKSFKSLADLKLHEKPHQTGRCHVCSVCDASFRWSKNLKIHRWAVHSIMEVKESRPRRRSSRKPKGDSNEKTAVDIKLKNRKRHHCDLCNKDVRSIGEHMKLHERRFSCPHCEKKFSQKQNLTTHIIIYHTEDAPLLKCGECDQTFKLQSQLKYHQAVHLSIDKQIVCDECGKTFKRKSDYENHCKARHGKSRLKCEQCDKTFPLRTLLNQHVKIVHTKELSFVCDVCGKQLSEKRKLKEHMRIHTGEKPYNCKFCGKAYMTTTALGLHRRQTHSQSTT